MLRYLHLAPLHSAHVVLHGVDLVVVHALPIVVHDAISTSSSSSVVFSLMLSLFFLVVLLLSTSPGS